MTACKAWSLVLPAKLKLTEIQEAQHASQVWFGQVCMMATKDPTVQILLTKFQVRVGYHSLGFWQFTRQMLPTLLRSRRRQVNTLTTSNCTITCTLAEATPSQAAHTSRAFILHITSAEGRESSHSGQLAANHQVTTLQVTSTQVWVSSDKGTRSPLA